MAYLQIINESDAYRWHINRPERLNAIGPSLARELEQACRDIRHQVGEFEQSPHSASSPCKPLVITAATIEKNGERVWIAGGDLKELAMLSHAEAQHYSQTMTKVCTTLSELPMPVIFYLDGTAFGGAAEFLLAGDIRIFHPCGRLFFKQPSLGLATGFGGAGRLAKLTGRARAQDILYWNRSLDAQAALVSGLCQEISDDLSSIVKRIPEMFPSSAAFATQKAMLNDPAREQQLFCNLWGNDTHAQFMSRFKV